jgi:hypothetical protein
VLVQPALQQDQKQLLLWTASGDRFDEERITHWKQGLSAK